MTLQKLNGLSDEQLRSELHRCCGCTRWTAEVAQGRPFPSIDQLLKLSDSVWNSLSREDWREAFAHHPRIGDLKGLREKFAKTSQWASDEQSGVDGASDSLLGKLAEGNRLYEQKFGYIFIVCATGKSAGQMLDLIHERLGNDPDSEIVIAAGEQAKITKLRLEKLVD